MRKYRLELSLTKFIKEGEFGFIKLGDDKALIENQFFPPEDWLNTKSQGNSRIWKYGNFELHFDEKNLVSRIFNDNIPNMDGGESIDIIDWWILKDENFSFRIDEIIRVLNKMKIDFKKTTNLIDQITLELENKVYLTFENTDEIENLDPNEFRLIVIGKE